MKKAREIMDRLLEATEDLEDELPEPVAEAVNELADELEGTKGLPSWKMPFFKDGKFSKTASITTVANVMVLMAYFVQAFFVGSTLDLGLFAWTVPAFDVAAAAAILTICNGTYVGNNLVKVKANGHG